MDILGSYEVHMSTRLNTYLPKTKKDHDDAMPAGRLSMCPVRPSIHPSPR